MLYRDHKNGGAPDRPAEQADGYRASIQKGMTAVRTLDRGLTRGGGSEEERLYRLKAALAAADAVVIGAGAGLSTAAGLSYGGERFRRYFSDFGEKYGIRDMYSGGFFPFPEKEIFWAWWSRHIYFNRYIDAPEPVYRQLLGLVRDREYFVITTNVDHQFQRAGFDKQRLFYTQGDYGLFQCAEPCCQKTWDNQAVVEAMMEAQGFVRDRNGVFRMPDDGKVLMRVPAELIPRCPEHGGEMTVNLRSDDTFVEDEGWHAASARYAGFLRRYEGRRVLYWELGVGNNTPVIIKYPFWQMTAENPRAVYACMSHSQSVCPARIEDRSICIDGDIAELLRRMISA